MILMDLHEYTDGVSVLQIWRNVTEVNVKKSYNQMS